MKHDLPIPSRGMRNLLAFMIAIAVFLTIFAFSVGSYLDDAPDEESESPSIPLIVPETETVEEANPVAKKP